MGGYTMWLWTISFAPGQARRMTPQARALTLLVVWK